MEQPNTDHIIDQIMQYSGSYNQPLITLFNAEYIMGQLDRSKIQSIDKIYRSKEDGFNLLEFIRFFLNAIEHEEISTLYLTIALIDFFKDISKSCGYKERLIFTDITNYICNRILQKRNDENQLETNFILDYRTIRPNYKIKDYLLSPPKIYANKQESVYKLSVNKIKIDKTKHQSVVTNSYFSKSLKKVFTLDVLSDSISVYNTSCTLIKKIKPSFLKMKKDIVVLAFAYSERQERIGAVLKDFSINFWDNSDNFQFQKSISATTFCQQYQTNIWFFQYFNSWVTSDKTGFLYIWNLETERPERIIKLAQKTKINDICVIPCLNLIAIVQQRKVETLMQDKKEKEKKKKQLIMIYDYFKGQAVTNIQLSPQNRTPHTIQYSEMYQVILLAGYQKKISLFEINKTFLDTDLKGQLTGHQSLITCFTLLTKSPMVVSADDKGKVKIWDIRNYKCVQTIDFRDKTNITRLLDMIEIGKVGVLGSRINFVDFDEKVEIQKKMNHSDRYIPYWIEFDYQTFEMIVLTKRDLRVYDMKKGTLKTIYCEFHDEQIEITYFKFLESLQKFVISNQKGEIKLFSSRTGQIEGKLLNHNGFVSFVEYDQLNKLFITMSQDSNIIIQKQYNFNRENQLHFDDDNDNPTFEENKNSYLLREIKNNFSGKEITVGAVSIYHGFIAAASSSRNIYIWDYEFSKLLAEITIPNLSHNSEPTCMVFVNGYANLLVGTSEGSLYCLQILRQDQNMNVRLLWSIREKQEAITHITVDILVKGFLVAEEKLVKSKAYIAYQSGAIGIIDFLNINRQLPQQTSATHKQSFNPQRQVRQNFVSEIQKKKFHRYSINNQTALFSRSELDVINFQAHKSILTNLQILELDQRYLCTIGTDERLKIWDNDFLVGDMNINLSLPYKWDVKVSSDQKSKEKIMFALKIIQKIFINYGNDISINESKVLKVRKLFEELDCEDFHHLTEPDVKSKQKTQQKKIVLFQNEFSKQDIHYDLVKKFNFHEIAGPTLKEIEVQKKLDIIQKEWQSNKSKTEEDKNKLLTSIRQKAQKHQQKEQIIQFLEERNFKGQRSKDTFDRHPFVTEIVNKLQNLNTSGKDPRGENVTQYLKASGMNSRGTEKNNFLSREKGFLSTNSFKDRINFLGRKTRGQTPKKTFENYYQQKFTMRPKKEENRENFKLARLNTANQKSNKSFRNILNEMNEKMQKSKRQAKDTGDIENMRKFIISTSGGRRRF